MPKLYWISNLRVFATIMVVFIHTSGGALFSFHKISHHWWWVANAVSGLGRFTVPVFVMISGALLLGKEIDLYTFLKKRFLRVWIPFTVWTVIYVLYHNFFERNPIHFQKAFINYLTGTGGLYGHLWFVYMILGLYLVAPFVNKWVTYTSGQEITFFLFICFISTTVFQFIKHFYKIDVRFDLTNFGSYIGYFVAGFALKNRSFNLNKWWYLVFFLIAYGITLYATYYYSVQNGKYYGYFYDYFSPNSVLMTLAIFMFFKECLNIDFAPNIIGSLDKASFGIYLAHLLIINILSRKFGINWAWHQPIIGIFAHAVFTLVISFCLIWLISKLPKSEWLVG
jgi:surface polysaccharide O-acyltransferase-like enzyme